MMMMFFISIILLSIQVFSVSSLPPCSLTCLNQTQTQLKPPPIFINDTVHDAFLLFAIDCSETTNVTFANVSIAVENQRSIEVKDHLPLNLISFDGSPTNVTFNLTVHGKFLGYGQLSIHVEYLNETKSAFNFTNDLRIDIAVKRKGTVLDIIFTVVIIILVCIGTFLIGCRLSTTNLIAHMRRPIPILIGLFSQFLCLPLVRRLFDAFLIFLSHFSWLLVWRN